MLTRDDLMAALARIKVTAPVRADEVTGSTNATAMALAEDGAPEWTLVAAGHQTEGRGRLGRTWEDVAHHALLFSFVLRPSLPPARAGLLSLAAGAAMARAIREVVGARVTCKWPNDLLLVGRKVGGILLESAVGDGALRHVVVGIGVNLATPTAVEGAAGIGEVDPANLLGEFLERFARIYVAGEPSWEERVRGEWLPMSATIGQLVEATTTDGATVRGRAAGIDDFGGLRLSIDTGEVVVAFGEIRHLGPA
jgi:BirA family transcriptional regulator, biotin operon repressor / biotin---[acetyl-CoA-carboxylase] ligase